MCETFLTFRDTCYTHSSHWNLLPLLIGTYLNAQLQIISFRLCISIKSCSYVNESPHIWSKADNWQTQYCYSGNNVCLDERWHIILQAGIRFHLAVRIEGSLLLIRQVHFTSGFCVVLKPIQILDGYKKRVSWYCHQPSAPCRLITRPPVTFISL